MNKKLLSVGLAGLIGLIGINLIAFKINPMGYEIPNKENTTITRKETIQSEDINGVLLYYVRPDGSGFSELLINNKPWRYSVYPIKMNYIAKAYELVDKDCDGIFETKYTEKELNELIPIPECYFNK